MTRRRRNIQANPNILRNALRTKHLPTKKRTQLPFFAARSPSSLQQQLNPTAHTCFNRYYTLPGGPIG